MNPDTRQAILEAASRIFQQDGYHRTSVQTIVSEVGVAKGTFYNYFKNKRSIFDALLRNFADRLVACFGAASIDEVEDADSYRAIGLSLGQAVVLLFIENQALARMFFWESRGLDRESDRLIDDTYEQANQYTADYVLRGQQLGIVRDDVPARIVAVAMVGVCSHVIDRFFRDELSEFSPDELLNMIVTIQLEGILI